MTSAIVTPRQVVARDEHAGARRCGADYRVTQQQHAGWVQRVGWLIEDGESRTVREGARKSEPLAIAERQGARLSRPPVGQREKLRPLVAGAAAASRVSPWRRALAAMFSVVVSSG